MSNWIKKALSIILLINLSAYAETYQWAMDHCEWSGNFNNNKINKKQIDDGFKLFEFEPSYAPYQSMHIFDSSERRPNYRSNKFKVKMNNAYQQKYNELNSLDIPPNLQYYKDRQKLAIENYTKFYTVKEKIALNDINSALSMTPKVCQASVLPFAQGDVAIVKAWEEYRRKNKNNPSAVYSRKTSELTPTQLASLTFSQKLELAKMDLIDYQFDSCMYGEIHKNTDISEISKAEKMFAKQTFTQMHKGCFND